MRETVRVTSVGDLLLCCRYDALADERPSVLEALRGVLDGADIAVGNVECPLTAHGSPRDDKLCLRGKPAYATALREAGFDLVSLANNHAFDYGWAGFSETRARLRHAGVEVLGAGESLEVATGPRVLERRGARVGFLAYCHASTRPSECAAAGRPGVAELVPERVLEDVKNLRGHVEHVVLVLHWGLEYSPLPTPEQVQLAHAAVDAGACLVLGHHSHMLQGIETYRGAVIAYSLGNCTDSDVDWQGPTRRYQSTMTEVDREGLALTVRLGMEGAEVERLEPLWLGDDGRPVPATGVRREGILARIDERSRALAEADLTGRWEEELVDRRVLGPLRQWWSRGSLWDKIRGFRPSQFMTLYLLARTFLRIRLGRSEARWSLLNPRNDERPMPYAGDEEARDP